MNVYEIRFWLPSTRQRTFDFLSDVRNLDRLTPPWLRFEVLTPTPMILDVGAVVDYRLRWHGLPLRWQSAVTLWEPRRRVAYEQRRGPYRRWVHEQVCEDHDGGTLVSDRIEWSVFGGFLARRWVAAEVRELFEHRAEAARRLLEKDRKGPQS